MTTQLITGNFQAKSLKGVSFQVGSKIATITDRSWGIWAKQEAAWVTMGDVWEETDTLKPYTPQGKKKACTAIAASGLYAGYQVVKAV